MSTRKPSRSTMVATYLVTLLVVLTAALGVFVVVRGIVGAVNGDQDVTFHREFTVRDTADVPADVHRLVQDKVVATMRVTNASGKQHGYAIGRDLILIMLVLVVLWLLRRILLSVRQGHPFTEPNVRRLRTIGFALLFGAPIVVFVRSAFEQALLSTIGITTKGLVISIPGDWLLGALGVFVLAQVFADGIQLRDEVEGTV